MLTNEQIKRIAESHINKDVKRTAKAILEGGTNILDEIDLIEDMAAKTIASVDLSIGLPHLKTAEEAKQFGQDLVNQKLTPEQWEIVKKGVYIEGFSGD